MRTCLPCALFQRTRNPKNTDCPTSKDLSKSKDLPADCRSSGYFLLFYSVFVPLLHIFQIGRLLVQNDFENGLFILSKAKAQGINVERALPGPSVDKRLVCYCKPWEDSAASRHDVGNNPAACDHPLAGRSDTVRESFHDAMTVGPTLEVRTLCYFCMEQLDTTDASTFGSHFSLEHPGRCKHRYAKVIYSSLTITCLTV